MNKQTWISVILAVALAVSVTINIMLCIVWPRDASEDPAADPATTTTAATTAVADSQKDMTDIETPYGIVKFPSEFQQVRYQPSEENGVYTLDFTYLHGEETVDLFAMHFGDEERGTLIGYVRKDGVDVAFTVTSAQAAQDDAWTTEEQEYYRSLMMSINDVIASVQAWDDFIG